MHDHQSAIYFILLPCRDRPQKDDLSIHMDDFFFIEVSSVIYAYIRMYGYIHV